jgi:hypothetical protein
MARWPLRTDGKLIDFGRKCEVDERELLEEMLEFVSDEVEELGNEPRSNTSTVSCEKALAQTGN